MTAGLALLAHWPVRQKLNRLSSVQLRRSVRALIVGGVAVLCTADGARRQTRQWRKRRRTAGASSVTTTTSWTSAQPTSTSTSAQAHPPRHQSPPPPVAPIAGRRLILLAAKHDPTISRQHPATSAPPNASRVVWPTTTGL